MVVEMRNFSMSSPRYIFFYILHIMTFCIGGAYFSFCQYWTLLLLTPRHYLFNQRFLNTNRVIHLSRVPWLLYLPPSNYSKLLQYTLFESPCFYVKIKSKVYIMYSHLCNKNINVGGSFVSEFIISFTKIKILVYIIL